VPVREERVGESLGPNECVLPLAGPQHALDAFLTWPRFLRGHFANACCEPRVAYPRHTAAIRVERFERLEAEEACIAKRADRSLLVHRTERVRAVLYHFQVVTPCKIKHRIHVA